MSGFWETPTIDWPMRSSHVVHLKTGKILIFDTNDEQLWTPPAGPFVSVRNPEETDLMCAGHSALADGRLLVVGGEMVQGTAPDHAYLFDPDYVPPASPWSLSDPMAYRRWYPTCTTLPDGKVLVTDGHLSHGLPHVLVTIPELFDPDAAPGQKWESLLDAELAHEVYPRMFVVPDGNPVNVKLRARSQKLMTATWKWVEILTSNPPGPPLYSVTHIMYEPGKVLRCGGATGTADAPAFKTTMLIDFNQASPAWSTAPSMDMFFGRRNHHLVMLPDGKVLVVGGGVTMAQGDPDAPLEAEIFDPADETWERTDVEMTDPRWAHATVILLRDAKVLVAGGDIVAPYYPADSAQIFRPPYLDDDPPRAAYTTDPPLSVTIYGQDYTFGYTHPTGLGISKVCLIRLAAITHTFDQDQRYVPLSFTVSEESITLTAPADGNLAPPGYYMLFILDANGVPCKSAAYVQIAAA